MEYLKLGLLGKNQWWRYLLTFVFLFVFAVFLAYIPTELYIDSGDFSNMSSEEILHVIETDNFEAVGLDKNIGLATMLIGFFIGILVLFLCNKYLHKKQFLHLFNQQKKIRWKHFFFGFAVWGILLLISMGFDMLINTDNYNFQFNWSSFLPLLLICLLMLPIQVAFEELFVRGYVMQGLYNISKVPVVAIIGSSVLFCFLHGSNPEMDVFGWYIMVPYYLGMAVLLAIITIWDKGVELAIGVHAANNILLALTVSYKGAAIQTDSIWIKSENIINYYDIGIFYLMFLICLYACYVFINKQKLTKEAV